MDHAAFLTNEILRVGVLLFTDEDEEYSDDEQDDEESELFSDDDDPGIEWRNDGEFEE